MSYASTKIKGLGYDITRPIRDWSCNMTAAIPTDEAYVAKTYAGISRNLRVSKAVRQAEVSVTLCGWDFRNKSVNGAVRLLK
jgi:hypothetical protein